MSHRTYYNTQACNRRPPSDYEIYVDPPDMRCNYGVYTDVTLEPQQERYRDLRSAPNDPRSFEPPQRLGPPRDSAPYSGRQFQGRGGYRPRPYGCYRNSRDAEDSYGRFNERQQSRVVENFRGRSGFRGSARGIKDTHMGFNNRPGRSRGQPQSYAGERGSSIYEEKRKPEPLSDSSAQIRSNQNKIHEIKNLEPSQTKIKLKRNYEISTQENMQKPHVENKKSRLEKEASEKSVNQNLLLNNEVTVVEQCKSINKDNQSGLIINDDKALNKKNRLLTEKTIANEKVTSVTQQNKSVKNTIEEKEKERTQEDRLLNSASSSTLETPNISQTDKEARIEITKLIIHENVKPYLVNDKKVENSHCDKIQNRKKITNNSIMQLKLFLLECNRKLKDNFKLSYILNTMKTNEFTDAIFSFEKGNSQNLLQVKYFQQKFKAYKKINFRTLTSAEFNLDNIYTVFKDNENIDRIVICSNLELDEQSLKKRNIRVLHDEFRGTFRLRVNEESSIFKKIIEKHSTIHKLAQYLNDCMQNKKQVVLKGKMKEIPAVLMSENVITIVEKEGRKCIGKLHSKFINNPDNMLIPAIAQLRRYMKILNCGELCIDGQLILSENFGKESCFQHSQQALLVQKLYIEDTVKNFFEKLEFMECEKNIDYYINQELGENFEHIHSESHVKAITEELFVRLQPGNDQNGLFQALERKISSCDLRNYQQKKHSTEMILEFESDSLQNLKNILMQSQKSTIIIKSDYPFLCVSKIQQIVKNLDNYNEGQYFFLDVDEFLSAKDNLLAEFNNPLEHLLIVQTEGVDLKGEQLNNCLKIIRQSISNDKKCVNKLVLIQNSSDPSFSFYDNAIEHTEIFNSEISLTKAFQSKLSETICKSYGPDGITHTVPLKELILEPSDLSTILTSVQCVDKLVKEKVVIGEKLIRPIIFESTYTIPRQLKRHVVVNIAALKEESQDIFFLFGDEKESKVNKIHYFSDFDSALSKFKQFMNQNKKLNVHLLKNVFTRGTHQLIWQRSSGSVNSLMKYVIENVEPLHKSEPISDVLDCRIMILSGKSGSGKSHYLFELAHRLQSSNQNLKNWVIQLNLKNSLLEQCADNPLSSAKEAVDFLTKIMGYNELHRQLFHLSAFDKLKLKLSLFVDGLEKLRENNADRICQMLLLLKNTKIRRIYVTARPELKKKLEQQLGEFAYNLDVLTKDEQTTFLTNTWISLANQESVSVSDQYAWKDYIDEIYNGNLLDIIIEPLYLNLFALVFWCCIKDRQKVPSIHRVCDIYREYLDKFLNNLEQSRKKVFDESFSFLSLKSLLHSDDFRKLNLPEVRCNEDFAKLNHLSFAEYGAAKWLASLPLQVQITAFNIMEDLAERISVVFIQTFALHCKNSYLEYIQQIGNNRLVVQLFTHFLWDNSNDFQRQKYLEEAIRMNRVKLVSELMVRSTEIKLPVEFLIEVTVYVVTSLVKDKPKKSHPYWSLSETLLEQVPQATTRMDPDAQLPQLLAYLFARGRHEVIVKVFQSVGDREKEDRILRTRVNGRTPLEIVNSSALMTDEQRLAISKFLIERDDSRDNAYAVMKAAARHGHVQCFEFFAGKSSEMRTNFLKHALKLNELDVLRFLLNVSDWTGDFDLAKNHPLHMAITEGVSLKTIDFLLSYGGVNNRNSNGETALCVAIKAGVDLRMIKYLVEKEADVNAKDKQGLHAWCYALMKDTCRYSPQQQLELIRYLRNKNCNLKLPHPDDYQLTCRIKEIQRKLEYLWDPGNYDLDDHNGTPRLHTALLDKDLVWFEFLLQHGADPDLLDAQNRRALHFAVKMKKDRHVLLAVKLLLRYGAMYDAVDPIDKKTPLSSLRSSENAGDDRDRAYKLLHQTEYFYHPDSDQLKKETSVKDTKAAKDTNLYWLLHSRDNHGRTFVHRMALQNLLPEDFDKLLQFCERYGNKNCSHGSLFDVADNSGETIIHAVARLGKYKILRELVRKGALLKYNNTIGVNPLSSDTKCNEFLNLVNQTFAAVRSGSLELLHAVAQEDRKFLVKARDKQGCTMLHLAALGHSSVTRFLLREWNANPNIVNSKGHTPLHYALEADDLESTKLLLKAGAYVDLYDKSGQLSELENGCNSAYVLNALIDIFERCWRAKLSATELHASVEALSKKFDLDPSVAVNVRDSCRDSMAHHAVRNNEPELLRALLKRGAVYNACNASNKSPVDLAVGEIKELLGFVQKFFKNPKLASWKEKDVFDVEIMTRCRKSGGYTLLHTALEAKKVEEAKWLMDRGADVNVTNNVGAPALKLAQGLQLIVV